MRFILNFIFFGILFFLIWHYFPEVFQTLVSWAEGLFNFVRELITWIVQKTGMGNGTGSTTPPDTQ
jgi:hypothetical protein